MEVPGYRDFLARLDYLSPADISRIEDVRRALYCSKIISYAQGYMLLREAGKDHPGPRSLAL